MYYKIPELPKELKHRKDFDLPDNSKLYVCAQSLFKFHPDFDVILCAILREDPNADGTTEVIWYEPERITSGRRDVNHIEAQCLAGAGCAITWQEDPVGLHAYEGEGPGSGWDGAITNTKTDIWYTYLPWEYFDTIDDGGNPILLSSTPVKPNLAPMCPLPSLYV